MPDRKTPPALQPNRRIPLPELQTYKLENGLKVHVLQMGRQPLLELGAVFPAGKGVETVPGLSTLTARLLPEGTRNFTSLEFAKKLDQFGAHLNVDSGYETATVNLTTLSRHLAATVPLMFEMVTQPLLDQGEFNLIVERTLNQLKVEEKKTEYVVRQEFPRLMFGAEHPYGKPVGRAEIAALNWEQVRPFYQRFYSSAKAQFIAVGRFEVQQLLDSLNRTFGSVNVSDASETSNTEDSMTARPVAAFVKGEHFFHIPESSQATIRAGHPGFHRGHPDFYAMELTNMIFGGYFSSRLNRIIREEKGYTYGIHSYWAGYKHAGCFLVHSDVGTEFVKPTFDQVRIEMKKMQDEAVEEDEFTLVKNYMLGRLVSGRETPSQLLDTICALMANGLPYSELDKKIDVISAMEAPLVQQMAQKYFQPDNLLEVAAGNFPAAGR